MSLLLDGLTPVAARSVIAAGQALDAGRVDDAWRHLVEASVSHPDHPEVLRMLAGIHGMRGRHQDAIATMRRALERRPDVAAYHNTLGSLLGQAGEYDAAIAALRRSCELQPGMAIAWYNLGVMLVRCVRNEEALLALERAVSLAPDHMSARALLADMLRMRGHVTQAASTYRRVIAEQPWAGMAWWGLADLKSVRFQENDISLMRQAMQDPHATVDDQIAIGFALAKALDDGGQHEGALAALAGANAMARRRQSWNRSGYSAAVDALNAAFTPPPPGADAALGREAIFIVGLPRSGSTLIEQILASHSDVCGAGELPDLPQVLAEESRSRGEPFPRWVGSMQPTDWQRLGQRYLERTAYWRREHRVFTDKLPSNWVYIGAIRAMLPGAHIVASSRDPLETCFSCYRQRMDNNEYTRDFDDLASFWRDCDRSLRHWTSLHPDHVMVHEYEAMLADPQDRIRRLLAFCGLPFEDACLSFHLNQREVRSPSATQVRQPLRNDTARGPVYGALLDPLRKALGMQPWPA
ncbi:MAG: sulfotransferase [Pseudomonadota bacterium]|jgi:Flp pilus assembly protein TadD|nr:sulfotransferase [Xanthomonadaceae bacterium]MDE2249106.1 sulfotransferase [Xanthomonadaceae bacterium]MDE3210997.1 sulfotransferase [Pseudomonadota bacterium]